MNFFSDLSGKENELRKLRESQRVPAISLEILQFKRRRKEKKREENSTELQKPNVEAEVNDDNKNVTEDKKIKSLIGFLSANKIDNYNGAGGRGKKEKKSKRIYQKNQKIRIINIFLESKKKKKSQNLSKNLGESVFSVEVYHIAQFPDRLLLKVFLLKQDSQKMLRADNN